MKLKEINRTAIQSWSPAQHHPVYLATGTSAQQLDASFSTNASLEFFELDLADRSLDMKSCGSFSSTHRYHKLVWGPYGMDSDAHPSGVLIAGSENGNVILYDPAKIMAGESDVIIAESDRHTGPVRALDVNPFQTNLFASGGNESEIYIWDMNTFGSPMTPGPKTQPLEDISCVAWNQQVQHILASASPSGRASVWDLRKNDLIIKVSDHSNRMHCSGLAWNPEVATQLVLASEDDRMPVIQMWDLRFATSPLKILENHTRGILSIAWSLADPELLLSCGKDNRILCWNPNTAEVLYELPTSSQWCFDIQWCPRNPAVLSAASFSGHIDIYSIMGGSNQAESKREADQISTSFGNMDPFGTGQTLPPLQLPQTPAPPAVVNPLKKPPKWIRRPVGASFAFGGKLVSLENPKPNPQQLQQPASHVVHVSQVVTETAFLKRSDQLQATLSSGSFVDFCQEKIDAAANEFEKTIWSFLKANFESDIRSKFLELLGYNKEELALKISAALEEKPADPPKPPAPVQIEAPAPVSLQPLPDLSLMQPADTPEAVFDMIAAANLQPAATLELDSTPEAEGEKPEAVEDLEEDLLADEPEEIVEQVLALGDAEDGKEEVGQDMEVEEEEILLDAETTASVEEEEEAEEHIPVETPVPVQEAVEVPAPVKEAAEVRTPVQEAVEFPVQAPVQEATEVPVQALVQEATEVPVQALVQEATEVPVQALVQEATEVPVQALVQEATEVPAPVQAPVQTLVQEAIEVPAPVQAPVQVLVQEAIEVPAPVQAPVQTPVQEAIEVPAPVQTLVQEAIEVPAPVQAPVQVLVQEAIEVPAPAPAGGVSLSISQDVDGLITQALLTGDFEGAVDLCLHDNRMADSIILAIAGGADLLEKTQKKYFTKAHSKITKLIGAVVMKDWHDILKTCDLQNWKEALAAVMTYAQPEEFSSLCDILGNRLDAAEVAQLRVQACLCYICAGNVEKLVSCWTKAQAGHCPLSLQDLVEKVVVLRRAVEQTQRSDPAAVGILLAEKMSQYANLLASQGSLTTAISYLPDNTNQVSIQQLRDRLSRALGQQAVAPAAPVQTQRAQSQRPAPQAQHNSALPRQPFTPVQPTMVPQPTQPTQPSAAPVPMQTPASAPAPAHPQYFQPMRAASTVTSWSNQSPTSLPNVPPPPQVGSASEPQAEPPNSMYGMPASSTAFAAPPASSFMYSQQYQPYPQVSQYPPGAGGVPVYQPLQYSSSQAPLPPAPAEPYSPPPHPPGFLSQYTQPVPSQQAQHFYPGQPPTSHCLSSSPPSHPPFFPPAASSSSSSFSAPPSSGASFQHGGPGSPVSYMPPPPTSGFSGPQNGWNDPPALSRATKKKKVPENYTPPAPITAPILSPLGADPQAQMGSSGAPQAMLQGPQGAQIPYSGMSQQHHHQQQQQQPPFSPTTMNPAMPKTSMEGAPGAPTGEVIQPMRSIPAEKIMKKPIPDEHVVLKTTFEGLIQKCLAVAADPQTKRKLDDANKRLEALYDKLREQTLSPAIVVGLHNIARTIESRAYMEGLNIHTHIVSNSNFSETSAFMPVLKVVLTQANKLGV
ncbi:protein transport protein Sec31A isoform X2 [Limanda limanda]|uniref:protein transport protein Sec31A isoform X2 n=1 Tax=Limanda limanda TaxID=27771 RepID=UPI0029C8DC4A|nr:protein transport protein Sec31A isoform X2 [Limanda limanda]